MIGIQLDKPAADVVNLALEQGLLVNVTADTTIRLLPPLILTDGEANQLVGQLAAIVNEYTKNNN